MATKSTLHLFSELERRYLECDVCSDVFNEDDRVPRLLPCHHTFCTACLKKITKRQHVKCPTCNAKHKVQENSVLKFPKDNTRRDLTSFIETHTNRSKCAHCDAVTSLVYQCSTCSKYLCEMCRVNHGKHYPSHEIKTRTNFPQMDDENKDTCSKPGHKNAEFNFFCNALSCQCVVCPMCVVEDHRNELEHKLEDIETAFNSKQLALKSSLAHLRDRITQIKHSKEKTSMEVNKLTKARHKFSEKLDDCFNQRLKNIQRQREVIKKTYNPKFEENEKQLQTRVAELDDFISNSEECCNLTEQLLDSHSIPSFLSVHQVLNHHVLQFLNLPLKKEVFEHVDYTEAMDLFKAHTEGTTAEHKSRGLEKEMSNKPKIENFAFPWRDHKDMNVVIVRPRSKKMHDILKKLYFFAIIIFFLWMPTKYIDYGGFFKELQLTSTTNSCFVCRNQQNTTYSTYPEKNMICGSPKKPYIFKGGFLNATVDSRNLTGFDFSVRFKRIQHLVTADSKNVIFEFGIIAQYTTTIRNLGLETKLSFTFYDCSNSIELCMETGDGLDIDVSRAFFASKDTGYTEGIFHFGFIGDASVSLVNLNRNETVYIFDNVHKSSKFKAVFATYQPEQFCTIVTLLSRQPIEFDRKTVHSSLFISTDNTVISNRKMSFTYEHANLYDSYVFAKQHTFQYTDTRVVFEIHFTVHDEGRNGTSFLEFGFGYFEQNSFHVVKEFKLIPCLLTYYFAFKSLGYCLTDEDKRSTLLVANSPIRLYIHYSYDGIFNLFNRGVLHYYDIRKFQFDPKQSIEPIMYVRRIGGAEIKINNDDESRLLDMGFPLVEEIFNCVFGEIYGFKIPNSAYYLFLICILFLINFRRV